MEEALLYHRLRGKLKKINSWWNADEAKIDGEWKKGAYVGEVNNDKIPHGEGVFRSQWGQIYRGTFR